MASAASPHTPSYTVMERALDGVVHGLGAVLSLAAVAILAVAVHESDRMAILAAVAYGLGLLAMIWSSAAYNLITHPAWKERVRRLDHAAIFVMIAGTYTPFALVSLGGSAGHVLLSVVWLAALAGVALKLLWPRRYDRLAIIAYLALGWAGLPLWEQLRTAIPASTLALLGLGGVLYTAGVAFHLCTRLRFHNAIWHVFVLAAATCHFLAVLEIVSA